MSERTERHPAAPNNGPTGEVVAIGYVLLPSIDEVPDTFPPSRLWPRGHAKNGHRMSERTRRHPAAPNNGLTGEGVS